MPSFDVVSKLEWAEVNNALQQAQREISQRFDFKGTGASIEKSDDKFLIVANAEDRVKAVYEVFREKLVRRKVSLKHFTSQSPTPGARSNFKMFVDVQEGIDKEKARSIIKRLKETKLKVQAAVQEDTVRVTGKKRDDLQEAIADLKAQDFGIELQFKNFRE